jgi:hypothetical protein
MSEFSILTVLFGADDLVFVFEVDVGVLVPSGFVQSFVVEKQQFLELLLHLIGVAEKNVVVANGWNHCQFAIGFYYDLLYLRSPEFVIANERGEFKQFVQARYLFEAVVHTGHIMALHNVLPVSDEAAGHWHTGGVIVGGGHNVAFPVQIECFALRIEDAQHGVALKHLDCEYAAMFGENFGPSYRWVGCYVAFIDRNGYGTDGFSNEAIAFAPDHFQHIVLGNEEVAIAVIYLNAEFGAGQFVRLPCAECQRHEQPDNGYQYERYVQYPLDHDANFFLMGVTN